MPGGADYARQRLEVSDLLCRIADHKLYFGDTERALELAAEAYVLPAVSKPAKMVG